MTVPYPAAQPVLRAPEGTNPSTLWLWLIVVLSALICIPSFIYLATIDFSGFFRSTMDTSDPFAVYGFLLTPAYAASLAATAIGYIGTALFAYLDYRTLTARAVPRPFHWATALVPSYGTYVYVIGRAIVVHRRTGGGLAPLWVFVALNVLTFIATLALTLILMNAMLSDLNDLLPTYR